MKAVLGKSVTMKNHLLKTISSRKKSRIRGVLSKRTKHSLAAIAVSNKSFHHLFSQLDILSFVNVAVMEAYTDRIRAFSFVLHI